MEREKAHIEIAELIHLSLSGSLSSEQERRLEEWIGRNPDLYRRIVESDTVARELLKTGGYDARRDLGRVKAKIASRRRAVRRRRWALAGKAAAVVIPLMVCAYFILTMNSGAEHSDQIVARGAKAVLVLDDGRSVELSGESAAEVVGGAIASVAESEIEYTGESDIAGTNTVIVPRGGSYTVRLADGTEINLNADSRITYPTNFNGTSREITLEGEAYFTVAKSDAPFIVHTRLGDVSVYGTQFNVRQYADENVIKTTLVEGSVSYRNDTVEETRLHPSEQLTYIEGEPSVSIESVDTDTYTAWRDDVLCFEDETLYEIMRTLARWYDIEFTFADRALASKRLSGRLGRYADFDSFVKIFSGYGDIAFSVEGRHVTVSEKR